MDTSSRQLARLLEAFPGSVVEVDVEALASARPEAAIEAAAAAAGERLARGALAVLATPRTRPTGGDSLARGARIAVGLARAVGAVRPRPTAVVAKGGITAAVTIREGLGASRADVVGPLVDGVSLWHVPMARGGSLPYVVFPGNVGEDDGLATLVERLRAGRRTVVEAAGQWTTRAGAVR